jgi:DNA recombination protein Rad52
MAFTDTQLRLLKAKLDPRHVRTRRAGSATLHYIEGWHVIAEANRIFGFDGWDRETVATSCVASGRNRGDYLVAYTTKVRITVRAGKTVVVREGSGTGEAKGFSLGQAHELALKSAETDATKRALASFGNSFGLALYDPEQNGIKRGRTPKGEDISPPAPLALYSAAGEVVTAFDNPKAFAQALHQAMFEAGNVDELFAVWQQNVETVRALHRLHRWNSQLGVDGIALVTHLKTCARRFADSTGSDREPQSSPAAAPSPHLPAKIDKSLLTIGEPKRIRSKDHLRFVAQQPCLICGRTPSHAHHIRYAQPRGLGLKVSDEFTVPLCAIHHSENHATGDERRWWQGYKIDPVSVASGLWTGERKDGKPRVG